MSLLPSVFQGNMNYWSKDTICIVFFYGSTLHPPTFLLLLCTTYLCLPHKNNFMKATAELIHLNVSSMKPWISFMLLYSLLLLLPGAGASSEIHLYQTQYYYSLTCHMPLTTPVGCSAFFVLHDNTFFAPRQGLSLGGRSKTTSIGFWPIFDQLPTLSLTSLTLNV